MESVKGHASLSVLDLEAGQFLAGFEAHQALNPASTAKLMTTGAALEELGPDYRYRTELLGHVEGDRIDRLVLRGEGDPSLQTKDLAAMAREVAARGVRVVGHIEVDQAYFDDLYVPPAFEQQPGEWASFRAPVSAVAVDRNRITLNVLAQEEQSPAKVWFEPEGAAEVSGEVLTKGKVQSVRLNMELEGQRLLGKVGGQVPAGSARLRFYRRAEDPRRLPGLALKAALEELGLKVEGQVALGGQDVVEPLASVESEPLSVLLEQLGKESDNYYAETIFKTLGAERVGVPGRSEDGAKVVREWMRRIHALESETKILNGSGLFDANRVSAQSLVELLAYVWSNPKLQPAFVSQLAVSGVDGTLERRLADGKLRRRIHAKTGTLARADALAGFVLIPGHHPLAFAAIVNGSGNHTAVRRHIDEVVRELAKHRP